MLSANRYKIATDLFSNRYQKEAASDSEHLQDDRDALPPLARCVSTPTFESTLIDLATDPFVAVTMPEETITFEPATGRMASEGRQSHNNLPAPSRTVTRSRNSVKKVVTVQRNVQITYKLRTKTSRLPGLNW
jgi:hypothetical protein